MKFEPKCRQSKVFLNRLPLAGFNINLNILSSARKKMATSVILHSERGCKQISVLTVEEFLSGATFQLISTAA